jgi:MoaA/NifB/PqqE/SkfB family radical SAM enzyme
MFPFKDLKQIHLEITNNCQASCPMCSRNHHGGLENPLIKIQEWTLEDFKHIINQEVLDQIEHLYFCGNFGDPLLNNDLIDMCQYVTDNSSVSIRIHTNGSLRNVDWWKKFGHKLNDIEHDVWFGIDGLAGVHEIYRQGTSFEKIINNAQSFISSGGYATWQFIPYKHNEHQIKDCLKLSQRLNFKKFRLAKLYREQTLAKHYQTGIEFDLLPPDSVSNSRNL